MPVLPFAQQALILFAMTKLLLALAVTLGLATPRLAFAAAQTNEEAARAVAEEWLALVDAGKYPESFQKLDPAFAKKVGKKKWIASITDLRGRAGKFTSRKFSSAEYTKELPGAPEGEYVVVEYESVFEKKPKATEKVILILGRDLYWRVAGYSGKGA
jgi:hypothetical protein